MTTTKSAATRQAILDNARTIFARKGYRGASVTDLTAGLAVTRANFYYYFTDKEQLFIELGTATYHEILVVIDAFDELPTRPDLTEMLSWVGCYFEFLDKNGAFVARSMDDSPDDAAFRRTVTRLHAKAARRLGRHIMARSTGRFASPVALGMSIMAMHERGWLLAHTAAVAWNPESAQRSSADILVHLVR